MTTPAFPSRTKKPFGFSLLFLTLALASATVAHGQTPPDYSSGVISITDANWATATVNGAIGTISGTAVVNILTSRPARAITIASVSGGTLNVGTASSGGRSRVAVASLTGGALDVAQSGFLAVSAASASISSLNVSGTITLPNVSNAVLMVSGTATFGPTCVINGGSINASSFSVAGGIIRSALVGSGALTKVGEGVATLRGANTFSGGTTISEGTLSVTGATLVGNVANSGTLLFEQDSNAPFAGVISGVGQLFKTGVGALRLTGNNTYSGTTTISTGTLIVTTASLPGSPVVNNAVLQFNQTRNGTFAGSISGTGSLLKTQTGNVVLSGLNSYTGGTTIDGGILVATTASLPAGGAVVNNATLQFNQGGASGEFDGLITGSGAVINGTSGDTVLAANNSYSGSTSVLRGQLYINGNQSSANGAVSVASAATLGGKGTVGGATTIASGGKHRFGTTPTVDDVTPGTQTFVSSLTYEGGATAYWTLTDNTTDSTDYNRAVVGTTLTVDPTAVLNLSFDLTGSTVDWSNAFWSSEKLDTAGWLVYNANTLSVSGDIFELNPPSRWIDSTGVSLQAARPDYVFAFYQDSAEGDLYLNYIYSP
jgi:autotransporter-associated beta strand protein